MAATIDPKAVVCQDATLAGAVTIGPGTVVHPRAILRSLGGGALVLGANNIVEECAEIVNRSAEPMVVGDGNRFATGCVVDSCRIGNGCTVEEKAHVSEGATLGNDCVVVATRRIGKGATLAARTVVYGANGETNLLPTSEAQIAAEAHQQHVQYLIDILPMSNHIHGAAKQAG